MAKRMRSRDNPDGMVELGGWKQGIFNKSPLKAIPDDALLNAVNVDISDEGSIRRRKGFEVELLGNIHSLVEFNGRLVFVSVDDSALKYTDIGSGVSKLIKAVDNPSARVSYEKANGRLFCSSFEGQFATTVVEHGGNLLPDTFGVPNFKVDPSIVASSSGGLAAGRYQIAFTITDYDGTESGANIQRGVDVPDGGGIDVICSPACLPELGLWPDEAKINIYISEQNGEALYRHSAIPFAAFSKNIGASSLKGRELSTNLLNPLPYVDNLQHWAGRLFGSSGDYVFYSEPYRLGMFEQMSNYMTFSKKINLVVAVQDGFYVCHDRETHWISGSKPEEWQRTTVIPYGAVPGTLCRMENSMEAAWMSDKGMVIAGNGGQIKNIQADRVAIAGAQRGAMLNRLQDGYSQLLSSCYNGMSSGAKCSDYAIAEVRKAGTF